jgi:hypothetical protein
MKIRLPRALCVLAALAFSVAGSAFAGDVTYAVLFSGGVNANANYSTYYNNMVQAYDLFSGLYGASNVWVLYADGSMTNLDQNTGTLATPNLVASPWTGVNFDPGHYLEATSANLATVMSTDIPLAADAAIGTDGTYSFVFYSFDHGSSQNPVAGNGCDCGNDIVNVQLNGWVDPGNGGNNTITNQAFAADATTLGQASAEFYDFNECYSNGMSQPLVPDVSAQGKLVFATWAASYCSYGDGYSQGVLNAISGGTYNTVDIAQAAIAADPFGSNGVGANKNLEDPGYTGDNFNILTNEAVPEPATMALAFGALGLGVWIKRRPLTT